MNSTNVNPHPASAATDVELVAIDAWWRAASCLTVGRIHLLDNPLLREPRTTAYVKPRLPGHWGTAPGLNLVHAHLNRVICSRDLDVVRYRCRCECDGVLELVEPIEVLERWLDREVG